MKLEKEILKENDLTNIDELMNSLFGICRKNAAAAADVPRHGRYFCRRARRAHFAGQRPPGCRTGSCRLRSRVHQADARGSRRAAGRLVGERPAETAAGVKP